MRKYHSVLSLACFINKLIMKKIFSIVLLSMLMLSACGPTIEEETKTEDESAVETKTGVEAGADIEKEDVEAEEKTDVKAEVKTDVKTEVKTEEPKAEAAVTKLTVVGSEFAYSPSSLSFKAGEQVQITFNNNGKYPHNLVIRETGVSTKIIESGATEVLNFTAPKAGSYSFYCSVAGHEEAGMKGGITVQ